MSLTRLPASDLVPMLRRGEVSSRQLCRAFLDAASARDQALGAFLHLDADAVLAAADAADASRARGEAVGLLAGLPVAIKDNLCQRGVPTTCASKMLANFKPPTRPMWWSG